MANSKIAATEIHRQIVKGIVDSAIRIDNDVNGNPRYYVSVIMFSDENCNMYRPNYVTKYRGKKFGAGWIYQSYNLEHDVEKSIGDHYNVEF